MKIVRVYLLGYFAAEGDEALGKMLGARKVQELLVYLLLNRSLMHPREALAELLWNDKSTAQSRKYLRQILWQLQDAVSSSEEGALLVTTVDSIGLNPNHNVWVDVYTFEQAYTHTRGIPGAELDDESALRLQQSVELYKGDLLEGWYADWCIFERERLRNCYLSMLDKLLQYHERHLRYEQSVSLGETILRYDYAHERTHRHLMRVRYLMGDRTGALRQYERCVQVLKEELDVQPSHLTRNLYEQIRADHPTLRIALHESPSVSDMLRQLQQLQASIATLQSQIQQLSFSS